MLKYEFDKKNINKGFMCNPLLISLLYFVLSSIILLYVDKFYNAGILTKTYHDSKNIIYIVISSIFVFFIFKSQSDKNTNNINNYIKLKELNEKLEKTNEELRIKEEKLILIKKKYKAIAEGTCDATWEINFEMDTFKATHSLYEMLGYDFDNHVSIDFLKSLIQPEQLKKATEEMENHIEGKTLYFKSELKVIAKSGEEKWILAKGKTLKNEKGESISIVGSISDISDRKKQEEQTRKMAYTDVLTCLPNKLSFMDDLDKKINMQINGDNNKAFFVLLIGFNNFMNVNNIYGHDYGDQLLIIIAEVLKIIIDKNDIVYKLDGDKFIIFHQETTNSLEIEEFINKILDIFNYPFEVGEKQIYISANIGIAAYPYNGIVKNEILKNADSAYFKAKESGENQYCFYNNQISQEIFRKNEIERCLREAFKNNELYINYQPQIDVKSGKVCSAEALLRWNSAELGQVSPCEFIPIAEETGLIIKMDNWVLKNVCYQIKIWQNKGIVINHIAVNLSPIELKHNDFIKTVTNIFCETNIAPKFIQFEVTEGILLKSFNNSKNVLMKLKNMGSKIALDDFGTGYSSLNYIRNLPIDTLKIDKAFISNLSNDTNSNLIVNDIIKLSHKLNLSVIAEGVEKKEQLNILKEQQCDIIQGFYYSKPLNCEDVERYILFKKEGGLNE